MAPLDNDWQKCYFSVLATALKNYWCGLLNQPSMQDKCVCMTTFMTFFVCAYVCLQGVNRMGKDTQVGRDGVRRKDWHDYDAIKRDASRSGWSKASHIAAL